MSSTNLQFSPRNKPLLPPGPRGYPLLGILPKIWSDPLKFFQEAARDHGDLVRMGIGRFTLYLVSGPDLIKYILQDPKRIYWKGKGLSAAATVMGEGLATSEGAFWQRQRDLIQPAFTQQRLIRLVPEMLAAVEEFTAELRQAPKPGEAFDLAHQLQILTLKVILRTLFSVQIPPPEAQQICRAVQVANAFINHSAWRLLPIPTWVPTPRHLSFRRALNELNAAVYRILAERRGSHRDYDDLLDQLLKARDAEGRRMNDHELRDEIVTLFVAGHETPASALAWTFYLLCAHPEALHRLRSELREGLSGKAPSADSLGQLAYLDRVLKESMRLYPPAWTIVRTPRADDELDGYTIPAGAPLLLSQYVVHRHPAYWERPELFDPDRWTPQRAALQHRFAYFPFGGGQRICIGSAYAVLMMQIIAIQLLEAFDFELVPGRKIIPQPLATLQPKYGIWVRASARH